jgi:hypothetical protein
MSGRTLTTRLGPAEGRKGRPLNRSTYAAITSGSTGSIYKSNRDVYRDPKSSRKSIR